MVSREEFDALLGKVRGLELKVENKAEQDDVGGLEARLTRLNNVVFGDDDETEDDLEPTLSARVAMLEDQFDDMRAQRDTDSGTKKKKWHVVLRGRFDEDENDFTSGAFEFLEECDAAVKGAWKAESKALDSEEEAWRYYEDKDGPQLEAQNAEFRNPAGLHRFCNGTWSIRSLGLPRPISTQPLVSLRLRSPDRTSMRSRSAPRVVLH